MSDTTAFARRPTSGDGPIHRLGRAGLEVAGDLLVRDRGCCFIFHRGVGPAHWAQKPNRGFHVDLAYLERLIRHLQKTGWAIVTMTEACRRAEQGGAGRFVNFSLDDGYRDVAELVVPLFKRLDVPVTLYITTGIPDGTMRLRDAGLETILERRDTVQDGERRFRLSDAASRRAAFAAISRAWEAAPDGDERYTRFCAAHGESPDALDALHRIEWPMLERFVADPLVEIGAHTISHPHVARLDEATAWAEIAGSRTRIEQRLGIAVPHFAFPYGQAADCGPRDASLAQRAGFQSAATTRKGLVAPGCDRYGMPRNTLGGEHRALPLTYLHLAGVSGKLAKLHRRG